ncbi:MAPEG family protein [Novosphingobium sp.]|uniref:MAPEG family protein n=1 Tax=Novosphingobium sp. TaxID=1874826 RepID=UPI00345561F2
MLLLKTTLCLAAAAVLINFWLSMRIGKLRTTLKISVGDGGNEQVMRRMRAQANFVENVPLSLILFAAIEAAGKGGMWLAPLGAVYMIGRICHAIGMDGNFSAGRPIGMITTMVPNLALVVVAVLTALGH